MQYSLTDLEKQYFFSIGSKEKRPERNKSQRKKQAQLFLVRPNLLLCNFSLVFKSPPLSLKYKKKKNKIKKKNENREQTSEYRAFDLHKNISLFLLQDIAVRRAETWYLASYRSF